MTELKIEVQQLIINMVADQLGFEANFINPETTLKNDLGADSLDELELVIELERMFDITIHDEDYERIDNVKISDLFELVKSKLS